MARRFLNQLLDGEPVDEVFLLADRQMRANRNADLYLLAQLRDRSGQVSGLLWNVAEDAVSHLQPGDYVRVRGKAQMYQGNLQIILTRIDTVSSTGLDPADFLPQGNNQTVEQFQRLREIMSEIQNLDLRALALCILDDNEIQDGLMKAPAGVKLHHAYMGGLLEHILNLSESALLLTSRYPKVDFDLLQIGILLHDIGKLRELAFETSFIYTDEGQLIGHLVIGVEMFNEQLIRTERATGREFPRELALRIKHMIVSHHGSYEFGSAKLPMTPEAIALHHLDNLDAKTNEFMSLIESDPNSGSSWTPYQANMQRKLFKGGTSDW
ncbi:MAG: HD domain-containing protein [Planctomycetaceae bacterium]|nr:HD domain-containing protein [Planctomycetaceae bacterium]